MFNLKVNKKKNKNELWFITIFEFKINKYEDKNYKVHNYFYQNYYFKN